MSKSKIGIALGSGSARGWSHIGVLRELEDRNIDIDVVCGASIGALVGAAYVTGNLDELEDWINSLDRLDILRLLDTKLSEGGFMEGVKLMKTISKKVSDRPIEELDKSFGAVATDLETGREVWLREGSILDAVRASVAMPGLFTPARADDRWLIDGGLVNPVPISMCRALGADIVIAVNLNGDLVGRNFHNPVVSAEEDDSGRSSGSNGDSLTDKLLAKLKSGVSIKLESLLSSRDDEDGHPGLFDVLAGSINIAHDRITRSRMAGEPPDILLTPRLGELGLMEFDQAKKAIEEGRRSVRESSDAIERLETMR